MGIIKVLDKNTINQIAAGEVIENPAAVVKELVENSIDAESNSITVEIRDGGSTLIRVTDNGKGIEEEDIVSAFLPHATSKIEKIEDIFHIRSLGFRGEALASIASVAKVELLSKTALSLTGIIYEIHGGEEVEKKEVGVPEGTTFVVRDLFYNTPARRKFLKSSATEARYVLDVMEHIAISHPHIAFKFINNGQLKFQTLGNGNLKDVLYYMFGKEISSNTIELDFEAKKEGYSIHGFIGKPSLTRGNREYENYFLNGRFIKNKMITKAIEEAYKPFIMGGKFPFTCLMIEVSQVLIDVNVHPAKLEVRFSEPEEVFSLVFNSISDALKGKELIPDATLDVRPEKSTLIRDFKQELYSVPSVPMPEPFENSRSVEWKKEIKPLFYQESFVSEDIKYNVSLPTNEELGKKLEEKPDSIEEEYSSTQIEQPVLMDEKILPDIKMIGQIFGTYWIIQFGDKVYLIDQHAAHEKVMFERFLEKFKRDEVISQNIYPPAIVHLSEKQIMAYEELKEDIAGLGFEIHEFSGKEYAIKAVPVELFGLSEKDAFIEILDERNIGYKKRLSDNTLNKLATRACKAAVKGNNNLSEAEAIQLIKDLMALENPYHCPHGRPTMIFMSQAEIEKKFMRQI